MTPHSRSAFAESPKICWQTENFFTDCSSFWSDFPFRRYLLRNVEPLGTRTMSKHLVAGNRGGLLQPGPKIVIVPCSRSRKVNSFSCGIITKAAERIELTFYHSTHVSKEVPQFLSCVLSITNYFRYPASIYQWRILVQPTPALSSPCTYQRLFSSTSLLDSYFCTSNLFYEQIK